MSRPPIILVTYFIFAGWVRWSRSQNQIPAMSLSLPHNQRVWTLSGRSGAISRL